MIIGKKYLPSLCTAVCTACILFAHVTLSAADPDALTEAQHIFIRTATASYTTTLKLTDFQQQQLQLVLTDYLHKDLMPVLTRLQLVDKWIDLQRDTQFRELHRQYLLQKKRKEKIKLLTRLKDFQKNYYPELEQVLSDPAMKKATRKLQQTLNKIINPNPNPNPKQ